MRYLYIVFCIFLFAFLFLQAEAKIINVPADSSTIQTGINGAVNGDTVLVADGHYWERITFDGKAIVVASAFIQDSDTMHIQNTVIDADTSVLGVSDTGSVVRFVSVEDSTSLLIGFTVQNGTGCLTSDSGVYRGGGIYISNGSSPKVSYCIIANNSARTGGAEAFI
jgi:hypothetical protein